jgi:hypothetical protein
LQSLLNKFSNLDPDPVLDHEDLQPPVATCTEAPAITELLRLSTWAIGDLSLYKSSANVKASLKPSGMGLPREKQGLKPPAAKTDHITQSCKLSMGLSLNG